MRNDSQEVVKPRFPWISLLLIVLAGVIWWFDRQKSYTLVALLVLAALAFLQGLKLSVLLEAISKLVREARTSRTERRSTHLEIQRDGDVSEGHHRRQEDVESPGPVSELQGRSSADSADGKGGGGEESPEQSRGRGSVSEGQLGG